MPKTALDVLTEKMDGLQAKIVELEGKLMTCVGDKCKAIETKIENSQKELDKLRVAQLESADKKIEECVGKHCQAIRADLKERLPAKPAPEQAPAPPKPKEDVTTCPTCELEIAVGVTECPHCHDKLKYKCPKCGTIIGAGVPVCPKCGEILEW